MRTLYLIAKLVVLAVALAALLFAVRRDFRAARAY
jgi:hypothetical protein